MAPLRIRTSQPSSATSKTINQWKPQSTDALGESRKVPRSGRLGQRQFLSVKQPVPTEIQLRITTTAQPNNPVKNVYSTTRIASTANLGAMNGPFYSATSRSKPAALNRYRPPAANRAWNSSSGLSRGPRALPCFEAHWPPRC